MGQSATLILFWDRDPRASPYSQIADCDVRFERCQPGTSALLAVPVYVGHSCSAYSIFLLNMASLVERGPRELEREIIDRSGQ